MEITLHRHDATDGAIFGELFLQGRFAYFTLERQAVAIPIGRYPVRLTHSQRAELGTLWTPDPEHRLPLIEDVPGRSGIRFHALNLASQSDGCIGVGYEHAIDTMSHSRQALTDLIGQIDQAEKADEPIALIIESPQHPDTRSV